ncbi:MAG: glycosyltransferase family 39 protein [Lachnospiraceae bacterium]|nr:glycosyltransferase family 39 protein [Lachnospiraceae bacterium]
MNKCDNNLEKVMQWCIPVIVVVLGAVLRLVFLGSMPGGMHQDESFVAWNAFAIFHEGMDSAGHVLPVYMADWGDGHSALYVWLTVPLVALNGGHITPFLSRLPQAIVAIFTLMAVYGIVRRLINREAALWSMFLLAICPWHIMMSRWGLDANLAPGFLMVGLYFFVRGLEKEPYLLVSAFFYGLCLYCYAIVWLAVPIVLFLQIIYGLFHKKLRVSKWSLLSAGLLFVMALPLLLFVAVNQGWIAQIELPFMTIPEMGGYRGSEIAISIQQILTNLKTTLSLLWNQNTGAPYDILLPWGLFYDIGRVFIIFGAVCLVVKVVRSLWKKEYAGENFLFIQLLAGGIVCMMVTAVLHQVNALYIPLVLCEGYGVWQLVMFCRNRKEVFGKFCVVLTVVVYLMCLVGFQKDYYTDYRQVADAYFGAGLSECVEYALEVCEEAGFDTITAEKGAQWPRLLLYTETLPSEYLKSVVYDVAPAPASFEVNDILIRTRIDYENLSQDSVYIIYFIDEDTFAPEFDIVKFGDWYVAVPKTK